MGALDRLRERGRRRASYVFDVDGAPVAVEFEALAPADYEALSAAHLRPDGSIDRSFLPALAAACAVGEDDDPGAWAEVVDGALSAGERDGLDQMLILLNYGTLGVAAQEKG